MNRYVGKGLVQMLRKAIESASLLILCFGLVLTSCRTEPEEANFTLQVASEMVLEQIVHPDKLDHHVIVFAWPEMLKPGDEIYPYPDITDEDVQVGNITSDTWFFWIDDRPGAHFAHPSRFVFVDQATGELSVSDELWWPVLNGQGLWTEREAYWDESNWVFSDVASWKPVDLHDVHQTGRLNDGFDSSKLTCLSAFTMQQEGNGGVGIVINGWKSGQSGEEDFGIDANGMHDALTDSGFDTTYLGPESDDNPDRDGDFSLETLQEWLHEKAQEMVPCQTLVIYITGHGFVSNFSGLGYAGGIGENNLQDWLEEFDPGVHIVVVIDACNAGSFIDSLQIAADVVVTATNAHDGSYGDIDIDDVNPEDRGSEFTSGYVEDWNRIINDPGERERVRKRAEEKGETFWETVAAESFLTAIENDAAYQYGVSFPMVAHGLPTMSPQPANTITPTPTQSYVQAFDALMKVVDDLANHAPFIAMPGQVVLTVRFSSITITGPEPWVDVTGPLELDGSFLATGSGTVAGFADIAVSFEGVITEEHLTGIYTMGVEGGLPTGNPIVYQVDGERVQPSLEITPEVDEGLVESFYGLLNTAFETKDVDTLLNSLHPAVIDLYGLGACKVYLGTVVETPIHVDLEEVLTIGPWEWEIDGRTTRIEKAYALEILMTAQGEQHAQETHLGLREDGSLGWFTDCGEPMQ
jgi:hypothetical protein